ncbi:hypothetical protein L1887_05733 [Cichorium endivia]|nr:hypothetical protein L1887_05733 [Cichorium endivia]
MKKGEERWPLVRDMGDGVVKITREIINNLERMIVKDVYFLSNPNLGSSNSLVDEGHRRLCLFFTSLEVGPLYSPTASWDPGRINASGQREDDMMSDDHDDDEGHQPTIENGDELQ